MRRRFSQSTYIWMNIFPDYNPEWCLMPTALCMKLKVLRSLAFSIKDRGFSSTSMSFFMYIQLPENGTFKTIPSSLASVGWYKKRWENLKKQSLKYGISGCWLMNHIYFNWRKFCLFVSRVGSLLCLMNRIHICRVPWVTNETRGHWNGLCLR